MSEERRDGPETVVQSPLSAKLDAEQLREIMAHNRVQFVSLRDVALALSLDIAGAEDDSALIEKILAVDIDVLRSAIASNLPVHLHMMTRAALKLILSAYDKNVRLKGRAKRGPKLKWVNHKPALLHVLEGLDLHIDGPAVVHDLATGYSASVLDDLANGLKNLRWLFQGMAIRVSFPDLSLEDLPDINQFAELINRYDQFEPPKPTVLRAIMQRQVVLSRFLYLRAGLFSDADVEDRRTMVVVSLPNLSRVPVGHNTIELSTSGGDGVSVGFGLFAHERSEAEPAAFSADDVVNGGFAYYGPDTNGLVRTVRPYTAAELEAQIRAAATNNASQFFRALKEGVIGQDFSTRRRSGSVRGGEKGQKR